MSVKGVLNISAIMLSCIAGLLSFVTFVLSNFYSTAQAEWQAARTFHEEAGHRIQVLEMEAKSDRDAVARDINEIKSTLNQIVEVKLRRAPPQ